MSALTAMQKLPIEVIKDFRLNRTSEAIPIKLQVYILEIDRAAEIFLHEHEHNVSRAALKLTETFPDMAHNTARQRIYDAINYFHLNSTVKEEAWNNYYADRMEDMAKFALSKNNLTEARRCMQQAREYRQHAVINSIDPEEFKPHFYLISPEVDAELLNLPNFNLKKLWTETKDFINDLPVDSKNKKDALSDASISLGIGAENTDYEDIR